MYVSIVLQLQEYVLRYCRLKVSGGWPNMSKLILNRLYMSA